MLEEVKQYIKAEDTDEDTLIQGLIDAAEAYLLNAGISVNESNPLYKLAVEMLVSHWYENRQLIGQSGEIPFGLRGLITQLQCSALEVVS